MKKQKTIGKLYDSTYEIMYLSQLGSAYLDAYEDNEQMQVLTIIFSKTMANIKRINNILQYKLKI